MRICFMGEEVKLIISIKHTDISVFLKILTISAEKKHGVGILRHRLLSHSLALAEKLGYRLDCPYTAYEIYGEGSKI